jgi:hypothetical protein
MSVELKNLNRNTQLVSIVSIRMTPFNPDARTAARDIPDLMDSILAKGQLESAYGVRFPDGHVVLADGNRRLTAMTQAGFTNMRVVVYDPAPYNAMDVLHTLFVDLNELKRRLSNSDAVKGALKGGPTWNSAVKSTNDYLNAIFPQGIPAIVAAAAGSHVVSVAKSTVKYCYKSLDPKRNEKAFNDRVANTLLWLVRNKQQQKVIAYRRLGFSEDSLRRAIENNKPTPRLTA